MSKRKRDDVPAEIPVPGGAPEVRPEEPAEDPVVPEPRREPEPAREPDRPSPGPSPGPFPEPPSPDRPGPDEPARPTGDGVRATGDGLRPTADGLRATRGGLQATPDGLRATADGLRATRGGLHATGDGVRYRRREVPREPSFATRGEASYVAVDPLREVIDENSRRPARFALRFITLLLATFSLVAPMAHLLEMAHKMQLTQEYYGAVQYIYQGWAWLGIVQVGALIATGVLFLYERGHRPVSGLVLAAFCCQVFALILFFTFTYPTNVITQDWSFLPDNWQELRNRWEYSHAVSAVVQAMAYILLLLGVLNGRADRGDRGGRTVPGDRSGRADRVRRDGGAGGDGPAVGDAGIVLLLLLFIAGCNGGGSSDAVKNAKDSNAVRLDSQATAGRVARPDALTKTDADFLVNASSGAMEEVQLGRLAETRASNRRVRNFGAMMVKDHSEGIQKLKKLAGRRNVVLPDSVSEHQQKEIDDLRKKTGKDFDKAYVQMMVKDHQSDINEFQKQAGEGGDSLTRVFASSSLQMLRRHMDSAHSLVALLGLDRVKAPVYPPR